MTPYLPEKMPPANLSWGEIVPAMSAANQAIARYDGMLQTLPNPSVLLSPFTSKEAVMSSRIEGTVATLSEVLEFEAGQKEFSPEKREDIHEILNYRSAMRFAISHLNDNPITLKFIKYLHQILLDSVRGRNKQRGEFRTTQNWIGPRGCTQKDAHFIPPSPLDLQQSLSDFENFVNSDQPDPLIHSALVHAQFELLHPFLDGNGRLGRLLIPLTLFKAKTLSSPMFYISGYFDQHRNEYYDRLQSISSENNWIDWLKFYLEAIRAQAIENIDHVKAVHDLYERVKFDASEDLRSHYFIQAIDAIFSRPIFSTTDFIRNSNIPKGSANRILGKLTELGVINILSLAQGSRPTTYVFTELLYIADREE